MASVDTPKEALKAIKYGFRLFAVKHAETDYSDIPKLATCPASKEADYKRTCVTCMACNGSTEGSRRASITILAH
jgi:hypothetical protein